MDRLILTIVFLSPALLGAQSALQIVEPADVSVVRPGQTLVVAVRTVSTYSRLWLQADNKLRIIFPTLTAPPYRFSVPILADIVAGLYQVWAVGCRRPGDCDHFDPITIDVEPVWPARADETQSVIHDPGVTVDTGGVPVTQLAGIPYSAEALEKRIGGTIIVEVTPNSVGHIQSIEVLSGPDELRKDVIKAVLT